MATDLIGLITDRLIEDEHVTPSTMTLVEAALRGPAALQEALAATTGEDGATAQPVPAPPSSAAAASVHVTAISVEGFRGIGPKRTLEIAPGPGLTLVVGRNGSGKSSFAEALELLLTGDSWRWHGRSKVWQDGWRNLHHRDRTALTGAFTVEGSPTPLTVTRAWADGAAVEQSTLKISRASKEPASTWAELGWSIPLDTYRPFLTYSELGSMLEAGPTELHDRLERILGLGLLKDAAQLLKDARLPRSRRLTEAKDEQKQLLADLAASSDPRARSAHAALSRRTWDLPALDALLGRGDEELDASLAPLERLADLEWPGVEATMEAAERLRRAFATQEAIAGSDAARARDLGGLLRAALEFHAAHAARDCPVCGRPGGLDAAWQASATAQLEALDREAETAEAAVEELRAAVRGVGALFAGPPETMEADAVAAGVDVGPLVTAWAAFCARPASLEAMPDHLESTIGSLDDAALAVTSLARARVQEREAAWRPLAQALAAWLHDAREALIAGAQADALKAAETWLKDASAGIRAERFAPVATQAKAFWAQLRRQSSVELDEIVLEGTGPARHLGLKVSIDGVEGAALGVMSQGELHAMALSLFLPRAMLPESPFRFLVIDDPVQSMDPARVDGLATVLDAVAKDRQVIVFTHDDRLAEAVRRLGFAARVVEVTRHEDSTVELRQGLDPVRRNLDDARALAKTTELPVAVGQQVVPGFCRAAIEAACVDVVRRRRLGRGDGYAAVEAALDGASGGSLLALALFDDATRTGEVSGMLAKLGEWASEAWWWANKGAHRGARHVNLEELVGWTDQLCRRIRDAR